jgi:hypothetical protein
MLTSIGRKVNERWYLNSKEGGANGGSLLVHCWLRILVRGGTEFASDCLFNDNHDLCWNGDSVGQSVNAFGQWDDKIARSSLRADTSFPVIPEKMSKQKHR